MRVWWGIPSFAALLGRVPKSHDEIRMLMRLSFCRELQAVSSNWRFFLLIGEACEFPAFKIPKDLHFFFISFERIFHLRDSFVAFLLGMMVLRNRVPSCFTYGTKYTYPSTFRTMIL